MEYIEELDEMDNKILTIIESNARLSYSDVGKQVGISRVAVQNRMRAMEEKGIIRGYQTLVDDTKASEGRRFLLDIIAEQDMLDYVIDNLGKYRIIRRIYALTGNGGHIYAEGYAPTQMRYEMFMRGLKHNCEGIRQIAIHDVQYIIKDTDGGVIYDGREFCKDKSDS